MFHSAILKLTGLYLIIIMLISISFSLVLFKVTSEELNRGYRRQQVIFEEFGRPQGFVPSEEIIIERDKQIAESEGRLLIQLLYVNLAILFVGGGLSYLFARKTLKPIEETHLSQRRFTADASHELRSPLSAMKSEIEIALRDKKISREEAISVLESNLEEVERLSALASGLLELTRDNKEDLANEIVLLESVISKGLKNVNPDAINKKIKIETKVEKDLKVFGDKDALIRLITILLDNAIKYSDNDKTVQVITEEHSHSVKVAVIDQGIGIKENDLLHIFDRFYRADLSRSKNRIEGYGLGLSIAQQIARQHGSEISVSSQAGKGSIFSFSLKKSANAEMREKKEENNE